MRLTSSSLALRDHLESQHGAFPLISLNTKSGIQTTELLSLTASTTLELQGACPELQSDVVLFSVRGYGFDCSSKSSDR